MQGYQLIIPTEINYSQLEIHIQNGAKFRIYSYTISLFFTITLKRLSPAILILDNEGNAYQKKYNNLTRCFGWWGIPWGPIHSIKSIRTNKSGGLDVTADILLNLDEEAWNKRLVELRKVTQLFIKPSKAEYKAFVKSF